MTKMLWVDDWREPPKDLMPIDIARSYDEAIKYLETFDYDVIYLDHDLGDYSAEEGRERTGYDIVLWLVERKNAGHKVPTQYEFLTANPVGKRNMMETIDRYLIC
jgi:hypothetical protein